MWRACSTGSGLPASAPALLPAGAANPSSQPLPARLPHTQIEPGLPDVPADIINATLAQFGFEYLVLSDGSSGTTLDATLTGGDGAAGSLEAPSDGSGKGGREATSWVPCSPDDLLVDAEGCHQVC